MNLTDHGLDTHTFIDQLQKAQHGKRTAWELNFLDDMERKANQFGDRMYLSQRQYDCLAEMLEKDANDPPNEY